LVIFISLLFGKRWGNKKTTQIKQILKKTAD
jgi:hypothetical protein